MCLVRLQKFLAQAGLSSRRAGEHIILAGRVAVNGKITRQLGTKIHPVRDRVFVDGSEIRSRRKLYLALHKPPRYLCTRSETPDRPVIGQLLPAEWNHLFSVGRLDADSEGLILLTNDGDFANRITHPRFGARKTYQVTVAGRVPHSALSKLTVGIVDRGESLRATRARLLRTNNTRSVLELTLQEGKKREIRRLLQALSFQVTRLLRVQIGPVKLGELPPGKWRTLTESEIESLLAPL
jgi:23S rRNA pseudouridine2605 synthase